MYIELGSHPNSSLCYIVVSSVAVHRVVCAAAFPMVQLRTVSDLESGEGTAPFVA